MQQRLSIITIGVQDLKKARTFYENLGWSIANAAEAEEIVAFDLNAMTLALYPLDKLEEDAGIKVSKGAYSTMTIAHNVESEAEVDQLLDQAVRAGGTLIKEAKKTFWGGYSGYLGDPDGTLREVAHKPFAKRGANGEFQWNGVEGD